MRSYTKIILILLIVLLLSLTTQVWQQPFDAVFDVFRNVMIAFGLAYITFPIKRFLTRHGIHRNIATVITLLLVAGVFTILGVLVVPLITDQAVNLLKAIQTSDISWVRDNPTVNRIYEMIVPYIDNIASTSLNVISTTTQNIISASTKLLGDAIIILFLYLYMISDFEKIVEGIKKRLVYGTKRYDFVRRLNQEYLKYLKGLVIITIIMVILYGLVFALAGHPYWATLAALSLFAEVAPIVAGVIINIIALVTAAFVSQKLFITVLIIILILPNIEGNIINPLIHRRNIKINPIVILIGIFVGNNLFGITGIILAIPTIIFYKVFKEYYGDEFKRFLVEKWNE